MNPINDLMNSVMSSLKDMVDVDTIVGAPVETADGTTIIPISKVGFGVAVGGAEFSAESHFGGGSGAGVSISPIGFLVVGKDQIRMIPVTASTSAVDKLVDYIPAAVSKVNDILSKHNNSDTEE